MKKYILSFFIPFVIFIVLFFINGILLDDSSILYGDSQYQYYQLLLYLKRIFEGNANIFYSFQLGFGSPMLATLAYYLTSPFNILVNLFSYNNLESLFILLVLVKLSLCGLTMYCYLKYHFKSKYTLLFSTAYALSFFIVANYYQIMWLDAYFLAPLLLLGIDKIIKENKYLLYGIVLFLIILTNYYMGYMCCVFSVLYFSYKYLLNNKKERFKIKNFLIISVLAGLMTMFLNLPNFLEIISVERFYTKDYFFNTDILGVLSKLFLGSHSESGIMNEFHPFLYIGVFNIILLVFYFLNKKITKREKKLSLVFLIILVLSIIIVPLNNFWHAFTSPIGFNFRYIYLFNILFLTWCLKSLINIKYVDKIWYYVILLVFLILANIFILNDAVPLVFIFINVLLFIIYLCIFKTKNRDAKILFFILVIAELFFNSYTVLNCYQLTRRYYLEGRYEEKTSTINSINDDSFYRMEFEKKFAFNDSLNYNYYGLTGWLSSANINSDFYNKIGYYSDNNMGFYNSYVLLDSLFGVKYYSAINKNKYYELIDTKQISILDDLLYGTSYIDNYLYRNPYALNLGYMVSNNAKTSLECNNGFECQNKMIKLMTNIEDDIYQVEEVNNEITITSKKDFYLLVNDSLFLDKSYKICIEKKCFDLNATSNRSILVENNYEIGDKLNITFGGDYNIDHLYIGYFDFEKFEKAYDKLKDNQLNITYFKENHIKGNVNVTDENVLFLTIPYNENFKILVDGQETSYYKVFDQFIGLDLENGTHDIEIIYEVKGLKLGIIISLISFVTFIIYLKKLKRNL